MFWRLKYKEIYQKKLGSILKDMNKYVDNKNEFDNDKFVNFAFEALDLIPKLQMLFEMDLKEKKLFDSTVIHKILKEYENQKEIIRIILKIKPLC